MGASNAVPTGAKQVKPPANLTPWIVLGVTVVAVSAIVYVAYVAEKGNREAPRNGVNVTGDEGTDGETDSRDA